MDTWRLHLASCSPSPQEQYIRYFREPLRPTPRPRDSGVQVCVCPPAWPSNRGVHSASHQQFVLGWAVTLTQPKGLNPRTSAGLQSLKEKKPGALMGGEPVGEDAKRAEPRAKDRWQALMTPRRPRVQLLLRRVPPPGVLSHEPVSLPSHPAFYFFLKPVCLGSLWPQGSTG